MLVVEVKEKGGAGFGDPLEMIDEEKVRRVRTAAAGWLAAHPELDGLELAVRGCGRSRSATWSGCL